MAVRGAELTAEKLLQATHQLMLEQGGVEPSVSQLCERAGVQVAMVSYCFGGKTQLLQALLERAVEDVVAQLERLAAADMPPDEKLRRHVAGVIRNFVRYPYAQRLSQTLAAGGPTVAGMGERFARPLLEFHAELLQAGADAGVFRPVDPTLFFFSLVGACEFLFAGRSWLEDAAGERIDERLIERFTEHTTELVLRGIGGG
ncbi:MAG TPA: TetR family transcriptional regulator [Solirubrobacteraceae bacterium]|nr:TetR family transcriptional regulator [Solirubrobacteraceae bacterium]